MALMALMMVWGAVQMMAQEEGDFTFNPGVRYSQWVTKARLNSFYANKVEDGFAVYDENGNLIASDTDYTDDCYVRFYPRWTGVFRIKIVNRGGVYNNYAIVTN
jgi:hypothetical protein